MSKSSVDGLLRKLRKEAMVSGCRILNTKKSVTTNSLYVVMTGRTGIFSVRVSDHHKAAWRTTFSVTCEEELEQVLDHMRKFGKNSQKNPAQSFVTRRRRSC